MAAEAATNLLTTRNITLVSYQLDEVQSSDDKQAQVLTSILEGLNSAPLFSSYEEINIAIERGEVTEGTFVLFDGKVLNGAGDAASPEAAKPVLAPIRRGFTVIVAKYRALK